MCISGELKMRVKMRAFSLIELLVVIAIVGLLAAVGSSAYINYSAKAKLNKVQVYASGVLQKMITFNSANGYFPYPTQLGLNTALCVGSPVCQYVNPSDNGETNVPVSQYTMAGSTSFTGSTWNGVSSNVCSAFANFAPNELIEIGGKTIVAISYFLYEKNGAVSVLCTYDAFDPLLGPYEGDVGINNCLNYSDPDTLPLINSIQDEVMQSCN